MSRIILASASLLLSSAVLALPAFGAGAASQSTTVGSRECEQTPARSAGRSILGGVARGLIGRAVGSNRVTSTIGSWIPAQTMLTDALLNLLDCDEQQKAAKATEEATNRAETGGAGASVAWRSESRPGVSGRSVVSAVDNPGQDGRRCMTVTDVVIIDGEETTMPKRMCRQPPSTRYARV